MTTLDTETTELLHQVKRDFAAAHEAICKLQGLDPKTHTWPMWSTVAHTIAWIDKILAAQESKELSDV